MNCISIAMEDYDCCVFLARDSIHAIARYMACHARPSVTRVVSQKRLK